MAKLGLDDGPPPAGADAKLAPKLALVEAPLAVGDANDDENLAAASTETGDLHFPPPSRPRLLSRRARAVCGRRDGSVSCPLLHTQLGATLCGGVVPKRARCMGKSRSDARTGCQVWELRNGLPWPVWRVLPSAQNVEGAQAR